MFSFGKKPKITVHVKVAGFVDRKMVTAEFDLSVPEGTTIKKLFALVDKSGKINGSPMRKIMALPRPPTVLVNGGGIDVPAELGLELKERDEVAVMTPVAGG